MGNVTRLPIPGWAWDKDRRVSVLKRWPDHIVLESRVLGASPPYTLAPGGSSGQGRTLWSLFSRLGLFRGGQKNRGKDERR